MSRYGGKLASPGKIAARAWAYSHLSKPDYYKKYHVVIASDECGDIRFLLNTGVPADYIIACDIEASARQRAKNLGVIVSPFYDIADTVVYFALEERLPLASVNVDLCQACRATTHILRTVVESVKRTTQIYYTYMRGRNDRFGSDENRLRHIRHEIGAEPNWFTHLNYQSFTAESRGSSMTILAFT